MTAARADVMAEKAESRNRHYWLYHCNKDFVLGCITDKVEKNDYYKKVVSTFFGKHSFLLSCVPVLNFFFFLG